MNCLLCVDTLLSKRLRLHQQAKLLFIKTLTKLKIAKKRWTGE
ncbi:hypothetical protein PPHE_a0970 [Pseudoalteromonas phenolica O-BC30]|nr:hypothetical protein [Pseudoalteromonas phenolica O-BC30]MBE0356098.1 hypothetical protein [Pseudoalteromonas phenolica O-BC30]